MVIVAGVVCGTKAEVRHWWPPEPPLRSPAVGRAADNGAFVSLSPPELFVAQVTVTRRGLLSACSGPLFSIRSSSAESFFCIGSRVCAPDDAANEILKAQRESLK